MFLAVLQFDVAIGPIMVSQVNSFGLPSGQPQGDPTRVSTLLHSDSEMEMEAEHYPNGVLASVSTRIVNGAYKHDDLQTDESSMGKY